VLVRAFELTVFDVHRFSNACMVSLSGCFLGCGRFCVFVV
jgi:hypothetical protein